ncbi:MAG: GEVED domain-containing protein, partial [Candidatus Nanohaloarchaeota archaeon QJJ-9]|nr:GEVED domain-containing protein [Candidatus Nanohaloarchaeota archaeon QJJ-9]
EPHIEALFSRKSSWKYNTSFPDSEPPNRSGKRWNERAYDDSDWNSGQAIVGFGPDVDSDVSDNGGDYFFRKDFAYNKYRYEKPRLFLRSDDSASVFLNGELVYNGTDRHNGSYWNKKIDTAGVVDISKGGSDVNASSYCSVSGGSTSYGEYIDRVEFNGIDWVSGDNGGYLDATDSISNPSIPGSVYEISVTLNTGGYEEYVSLAFDWDNDGQLSDSDVYRIGSCGSDGCTVSEQIEVPEEASNGSIIMRVMGEWGGYHTDPCSDPNYNEIEDYSATIAGYEENTTGLNESMLRDGTNTLAVELENNDSESAEFDMEFNASITKNRSMIMMSDGEANEETSMTDVPDHDDDGDVDAKDHAIEAGCRAWENYNVTVYAVGFGSGVDNQTLNLTAQCGNGDYYFSSTGELEEVFSNISESIMEASREGQRIEVVKGGLNDTLYPDSYLRLNYSDKESLNFGEFRITQRSPRFGGVVSSPKNGSFYVPQKSKVDSARLLSYSSIYWTDRVSIQNATGSYENVYNLSRYGENYEQLGDPYTVNIPSEKVSVGFENNVSVDTGLNWSDRRGGSPDSMVVYDLLVDGFVGYGKVFSKSEGGSTTVSTDYGSFELEVGNSSDKWDPVNDSIDNATARLLEKLDVDDDNSIDFQMDSEDLEIDGNALKGLEWMWGPVRLSVEVWD